MQWIKDNIMDWTNWTEWLGLLAAALVLVSFLMKDETKIRAVNIFGCLVFVVYGFFIKSASVWAMNVAVCVVHVVRLTKSFKSKKSNGDKTAEQNCEQSDDNADSADLDQTQAE